MLVGYVDCNSIFNQSFQRYIKTVPFHSIDHYPGYLMQELQKLMEILRDDGRTICLSLFPPNINGTIAYIQINTKGAKRTEGERLFYEQAHRQT